MHSAPCGFSKRMYSVQNILHPAPKRVRPGAGCTFLFRRCYAVTTLRQGEHHERAARVADTRIVAEGANRAERGGRILRADPQSDARSRPAAHPGEHGAVLLAVGPQVRRRALRGGRLGGDRKSTRLKSSHRCTSYAVFCLIKKKTECTAATSCN